MHLIQRNNYKREYKHNCLQQIVSLPQWVRQCEKNEFHMEGKLECGKHRADHSLRKVG